MGLLPTPKARTPTSATLSAVRTAAQARRVVACEARPGRTTAERHACLVDEDPAEPGVEARPLTQSGQVAPSLEEGLLGDVLGVAHVSGDRLGEPVGLRQPGGDESVEGVAVAVAGAFDEEELGVDARDRAVRHHRGGSWYGSSSGAGST